MNSCWAWFLFHGKKERERDSIRFWSKWQYFTPKHREAKVSWQETLNERLGKRNSCKSRDSCLQFPVSMRRILIPSYFPSRSGLWLIKLVTVWSPSTSSSSSFYRLDSFSSLRFSGWRWRKRRGRMKYEGWRKRIYTLPSLSFSPLTSLFTCFVYFWSPVGLKFSLKVKDRQTDVMQLSMFLLQCNTWRINAFTTL